MKTNVLLMVVCLVAGAVAFADVPAVAVTSVVQNDDESVEVVYSLTGADAVVTMDVLQNGVSIGDGALWAVEGDVNRKVTAGDGRKIVWRPDVSWPGHKLTETAVSVKLRAWPLDDTPDYLVVDLAIVHKLHHAQNTSLHINTGRQRLIGDNQHVQLIAILI